MSSYMRGAVLPGDVTPAKRIPTAYRINKVVQRLVKASIEDSWKGGGAPEDIPEIELELKRAINSYEKLLGNFK